jgi:hypothetical protein
MEAAVDCIIRMDIVKLRSLRASIVGTRHAQYEAALTSRNHLIRYQFEE